MEAVNKVWLAGAISYIKPIQTKTGTPMAACRITADKLTMNCVAFNENATSLLERFEQDDEIKIVGSLQNNSYEKDGVRQYTYQTVIDEIK